MRTIVVNSELPTAHQWESTRHQILLRWGRYEEAERARISANFYAQKILDVTGVYVAKVQ